MPKAEILDPQGQAISRALERLGVGSNISVRQGKRFELVTEEQLTKDQVESIASGLLANTVIESFRVIDASQGSDADVAHSAGA